METWRQGGETMTSVLAGHVTLDEESESEKGRLIQAKKERMER